MCGRYTLTATPEQLAELLGLDQVPDFPPRFNVAPTQPVSAVRVLVQGEGRQFDLRTLGVLTPIKAQNGNQSCWTFPPMAALESNLLPGERWDFAEENMRCAHGFDLGPQDGGNAMMAMAYLARTGGPVDEKDHPYPTQKNAP